MKRYFEMVSRDMTFLSCFTNSKVEAKEKKQ